MGRGGKRVVTLNPDSGWVVERPRMGRSVPPVPVWWSGGGEVALSPADGSFRSFLLSDIWLEHG